MDTGLQARVVEVEAGLSTHLRRLTGGTYSDRSTGLIHIAIAAGLDKAKSIQDIARSFGVDIPLNTPDAHEYLFGPWSTTIGRDIAEPHGYTAPEFAAHRIISRPHEHGHVDQYNEGVKAGWLPEAVSMQLLYLAGVVFHADAGEAFVGKIEGDQYATTAFMQKWLTGVLPGIKPYLDGLQQSYNLLGVGSTMASAVLNSHYDTMRANGVPNVHICEVSYQWLEANALDIKGRVTL